MAENSRSSWLDDLIRNVVVLTVGLPFSACIATFFLASFAFAGVYCSYAITVGIVKYFLKKTVQLFEFAIYKIPLLGFQRHWIPDCLRKPLGLPTHTDLRIANRRRQRPWRILTRKENREDNKSSERIEAEMQQIRWERYGIEPRLPARSPITYTCETPESVESAIADDEEEALYMARKTTLLQPSFTTPPLPGRLSLPTTPEVTKTTSRAPRSSMYSGFTVSMRPPSRDGSFLYDGPSTPHIAAGSSSGDGSYFHSSQNSSEINLAGRRPSWSPSYHRRNNYSTTSFGSVAEESGKRNEADSKGTDEDD